MVTIFDAEDEPHPDIFNVVNTVMLREEAQVVQCGVQLMNYADRWFSALNVLEYFFWFKSRMHYHARGRHGAAGRQHRLLPARAARAAPAAGTRTA